MAAILATTSACTAAAGAMLAATDIRRGIAGLQQLVGFTQSLPMAELELPEELESPLIGTYRAYQALGDDTIRYYVRTAAEPVAAIVDEAGNVTGYALGGMAAATLDTLEARIGASSGRAGARRGGQAMFFIEGTQAPTRGARALYPAAFLGRLPRGESAAADRQDAELRALDIDMEAPNFSTLAGRGIPHELFGSVADGVFSLTPAGAAVYHQEYELDDGRTLTLHHERISRTTLPS